MQYPYSFTNTSDDFKNVIANPSSSLCGNFINAILKLPILVYNFVLNIIDTSGNLQPQFLSMIFHPGDIRASAAAQQGDPLWLLCNGQEVPKATYPDLYAAIGDVYGSAPYTVPSNGNNFKLPDYTNQTLIGVGTSAIETDSPNQFNVGVATSIGSQIGEDAHVVVSTEMTPHQHLIANGDTIGSFSGTPIGSTPFLSLQAAVGSDNSNYILVGDSTLPDRGITTKSGGQLSSDADAAAFTGYTGKYKAAPHNNIQPSTAVYFYVFTGVPVTT